MGRKSVLGLYERNGVYHIDKRIRGFGRLQESTGRSNRDEAEKYLIKKLEEIRQVVDYGVKPKYRFSQAAAKYLRDHKSMRSIDLSGYCLNRVEPYIGHLFLEEIDDEALQPFVNEAQQKGNSDRTINIVLQRVARVLNLAATKWKEPHTSKFWLDKAPKLTMLGQDSAEDNGEDHETRAYPLSWDEQRILFSCLAPRIRVMSLFDVNTGLREQEVCKLKWEWELKIPELQTSVFVIPHDFGGRKKKSGVKSGVKNKKVRLVVLNQIAKSIIDEQCGKHPVYVFGANEFGEPLSRMYNTTWKLGRERAVIKYLQEFKQQPPPGFATLRVHDLKHTFGRRLRAAGVGFEDRQVLLGHKNRSVTTDYSAPEIAHLIEQANKLCGAQRQSTPTLIVLKQRKIA
jgi:integrase